MSVVYIVLVCFAAAVLGQPPERCCMPAHSWEAVMTNTSQINGDAVEFSNFYSDYDIKMDAQQHMIMKPGSPAVKAYRLVTDYKKGKMYYIPEKGKCLSFPGLRKMFAPCVSNDAVFLGTNYVGTSKGGVAYNGWRWTDQNLTITIGLSTDSCVPIIEGVKGPGIDTVYFFNGFNYPITDRSVFKVPAGC